MWRWDRNLHYIAKSLVQLRVPREPADAEHYARVHAALDHYTDLSLRPDLSLAAAGDLMWIRSGWARALSPGVQASLAADLALANLETPIDPERRVPRLVYERYNAPPAYLQPWQDTAPRRLFSLCNNHALDQGPEGLARTRAAVLADPAHSCLGGPSAGDEVIGMRIGRARIALFAFTYDINHLAGPPPAGVPVLRLGSATQATDWTRLAGLIAAAREIGPDLVIAMPHWGFEYEYWPDARMRADARRMMELGVDLVIGSSPHVLQPIEPVSIDGGDPDCPTQVRRGGRPRVGLIAYSLGNLLSIMPTLACRTGVVLRIGFTRTSSGALTLARLAASPTRCGRGVPGGGWLDAGVRTLAELSPSTASPYRDHARTLLGAALIP
jgi:poly-gamma-glutamate synthesis protein (capsule biosynthesis protein)